MAQVMPKGYKLRVVLFTGFFFLGACSLDSPKRRYILADRLFVEKKYEAAVSEFKRVALLDTTGDIGATALYRAAIIDAEYLNKNSTAIDYLKSYLERQPKGPYSEEARQLLAKIFYEKLDRYEDASKVFDDLLNNTLQPHRKAEFMYKKARSVFLSQHFEESRDLFLAVHQAYPETLWGERAYFDYGLSILTLAQGGDQERKLAAEQINEAIDIFTKFLKQYPQSQLKPEVGFELAGAFEEIEEWNKSIEQYESILDTYPSKGTVILKMTRLKERRLQKEKARPGFR